MTTNLGPKNDKRMMEKGRWQLRLIASQGHFNNVRKWGKVKVDNTDWYVMLVKWKDAYCYAIVTPQITWLSIIITGNLS